VFKAIWPSLRGAAKVCSKDLSCSKSTSNKPGERNEDAKSVHVARPSLKGN
jgi:hypothetical protein